MVEDTWKKELTPEKQMTVEQANENVKTGKKEVPEKQVAEEQVKVARGQIKRVKREYEHFLVNNI